MAHSFQKRHLDNSFFFQVEYKYFIKIFANISNQIKLLLIPVVIGALKEGTATCASMAGSVDTVWIQNNKFHNLKG